MIEFWDFFHSIRNIYHFSSQDSTSTELLFCYESPDTLLYNLWDCIQLQKLALSFLPSQTEQQATLSVIPESNTSPLGKSPSSFSRYDYITSIRHHSQSLDASKVKILTHKFHLLTKWSRFAISKRNSHYTLNPTVAKFHAWHVHLYAPKGANPM